VQVEKFFARNLGGLIHTRTRVPGRLGKATSRTPIGENRSRPNREETRVQEMDAYRSCMKFPVI
jgi:hypothetical protein